jgi:hypothetical protein
LTYSLLKKMTFYCNPNLNLLWQFCLGIFSIFVGGLIYILCRSEELLMFRWFELLGLESFIRWLRSSFQSTNIALPEWVYYSLPNALWCFGGILIIAGIWRKNCLEKSLWLLLFAAIGFGFEIGQLLNIIPGTYDWNDLILMLVFIPFGLYLCHSSKMSQIPGKQLTDHNCHIF